MKYIKNLLFVCLLIGVFCLSGCMDSFEDIKVDTNLTVNTSFNGKREMTCDISAKTFKSFFGSDLDNLKTVIDKYIPGDMYCTASSLPDGGAHIIMRIDFASLAEYQEKLTNICKANKSEGAITPSVTFDYSRSILKNGYTIEENFSSLDLFYWLDDAMITEYPALSDAAVTSVFVPGKTEVVFDGEKISNLSGNIIKVSDIESNAFNSITVQTEVDEDGSISAEIKYVVSNEVVGSLGNRLETMMNNLTPKDASLGYIDGTTRRTYTLTFSRDTEEEFKIAVNKALATNNTIFEVSAEGDTESLSAKKLVRMYFDGSYFLDFTLNTTKIIYRLIMPANYSLEEAASEKGFLEEEKSSYSNNKCEITMTLDSSDTVAVTMGFAVDIERVAVDTVINGETNLDRTFTFRLSKDADSLIGKSISERLNGVKQKWNEKGAVETGSDAFISTKQYYITLHASSAQELTDMTIAVLGGEETPENSSEAANRFTGGLEKNESPWKLHFTVEDSLNLSEFLRGSNITTGILYSLTYPKRYTASFTENDSYEDAVAEDEKISCSTNNKIMVVKSTAETYNIEGIAVFAIWCLTIVIMFVIAVIYIDHIVHFLNTKTLDVEGEKLFKGRSLAVLTTFFIAAVCFIVMTIRLIFKVY